MPFFATPQSPFQAALLPASFNGVPFAVLDNRIATGRRLAVHEYPFRDTPWAEDLGKRARRISFSAFVLGDDVRVQALALLAVCELPGPGLLIHPEYGPGLWQIESVESEERWDKGRYVEFRLAFVEPGQVLYPTSGADTQAGTMSAADNATDAADMDFSDGVPGGDVTISDLTTTDSATGAPVP
jgi:prophage DNA circulation protein